MYGSGGGSASSGRAPDSFDFDSMECALDGVTSPAALAESTRAAMERADSDPEQIMLSLRGLPVFPNPPRDSDASTTPEAAFIVAGGPTCLLREVLMAPYPHPEAPPQLYATLDAARRCQNISEFKSALRALTTVLRVWKKKHVWSILRSHPDWTLTEGLEEEVRRAEERRLRAIYKQQQREKREEEERIFQAKMAEQGENGEEAPPTPPVEQATAEESDEDDEDDDEYDDDDDYDDDHPRRRRKHKVHAPVQQAEAPVEVSRHEQPEEILEFPSVTPEEELEFLTFYYNVVGTVYQSAGAAGASSSSVGRFPHERGDCVKWGRMKVIPCAADSQLIRTMIPGIKGVGIVATATLQPAYAANLETSILEEEEVDETDEDYIASSPTDISNSADARALIALWQAKRAHDLYVALREGEKNRALQDQRDRDAAARGKNTNDLDDDDEIGSIGLDSNASVNNVQQNLHTTLGLPGFARINIPNLSLSELQSESKALGLFGFPHLTTNLAGSVVGVHAHDSTHGSSTTSQSIQDMSQTFVFWSTQPILQQQPFIVGSMKLTESQKSIGMNIQSLNAANMAANRYAQSSQAQKLIHPYTHCSSSDAVTYSNLGTTLFHMANYPLALRCFYVSLQLRMATIRPQEDEYIDVATSLNNIGVVLSQLGWYELSWNYFRAAQELGQQRFDPIHPRLNLITNNLKKIHSRRVGILEAPGLLSELRMIASTKEKKEYDLREKRLAKEAKKGMKGSKNGGSQTMSPKPTTRKTGRPGKGEEVPKEFHEDTRFFQTPVEGQPPIVPVPVSGAVPGPLGSAAASIKLMPLRQFDVQQGEFQKLLLEFGPPKKKTTGGKGKGSKSKKK